MNSELFECGNKSQFGGFFFLIFCGFAAPRMVYESAC